METGACTGVCGGAHRGSCGFDFKSACKRHGWQCGHIISKQVAEKHTKARLVVQKTFGMKNTMCLVSLLTLYCFLLCTWAMWGIQSMQRPPDSSLNISFPNLLAQSISRRCHSLLWLMNEELCKLFSSFCSNRLFLTSAWQASRRAHPLWTTSVWFISGVFVGVKARKINPLLSCHQDVQVFKNPRSVSSAMKQSRWCLAEL